MRFDTFHPAINLIYFAFVIAFLIIFNHPVFVLIGFLSISIYLIILKKGKGVAMDLFALGVLIISAFIYSSYNHFGLTVLFYNRIGNAITMESLIYGGIIGLKIAEIIVLIAVISELVTSDKILYLISTVSPGLSLMMSVALRNIPKVSSRMGLIKKGRTGIGKGFKGMFITNVVNFFKCIGILISWCIDSIMSVSESMKSRGVMLKKRTAYSIYRFENRDRALVILFFIFITVLVSGYALNQMTVLYKPEIIIMKPTFATYLLYVIYAGFILVPAVLQVVYSIRINAKVRRAF